MNNKKIFYLTLIILLSFTCIIKVNASTEGYLTGDYVRIRKSPNTDSDVITSVNSGTVVSILDQTPISGTGCNSGWYKISYNGQEGYICSGYIKIGTINPGYNTSPFTARVYANTVSARVSPSSSASRAATLINGTNVTVVEVLSSGNGCGSNWYKVKYHDDQTGYVCSEYIIKKEDVTSTDSEYEKTLKEAGFPDTYIPYLVYLHKKYPNWQFKAIKTNIEWNKVVSGESGKNYIENTTYSAYRTSSKPKEGSSWFEATDGVNAYFIDPRNFLTEKYIFMFENLQYDESTQGSDVIKSIFGSGYLSADEYVGYFIEAGKKFNVSPVHLAARVVQEGGAKSTYEPITGKSTRTYRGYSLAGYYNYFNIGAYADSYTSSPVVRGLAYARGVVGGNGTSYGRPWDSRKKAIFGGAEFISDGYISEGQYTLYFEKFNTSPTSGYNKFTHQYMTNVQAPSSEASNVYSSYNSNGIIGNSYVFAIPIYEKMPSSVSLPAIGDVVNTLSSISINGTPLVDFDSDVISYSYYVPEDATSVTLGAEATSSLSKVEGVGEIKLETDEVAATIKVISQTGEIKVYTVLFKKAKNTQTIDEIMGNVDVKITNGNLTGLASGTDVSRIVKSIQKYGPSANITVSDTNGTPLAGTSLLSTGQVLTVKTETETKKYNISIKGDTSGDGKITILDLLQIQKHILNSKRLNGVYNMAGDTSGDNQVTILDLLQVQKHILGVKKIGG